VIAWARSYGGPGSRLLHFLHGRPEHVRNIHGDEIVERGWARSLWKCPVCGKVTTKPEPFFPEERRTVR
jgi:hypothetical protein